MVLKGRNEGEQAGPSREDTAGGGVKEEPMGKKLRSQRKKIPILLSGNMGRGKGIILNAGEGHGRSLDVERAER